MIIDAARQHLETGTQWIVQRYFWDGLTPNQLTYARLVVAGLILVMMLTGVYGYAYEHSAGWALLLLIIVFAFLSDLFDGPLARARKLESEYGALLDPYADKLLVVPIVTYHLWDYDVLLVIAIILGESVSQIGRWWYGKFRDKDMRANVLGKLKFLFQAIGIFLVFWGNIWLGDWVLIGAFGLGVGGLVIQLQAYGALPRLFRWVSNT